MANNSLCEFVLWLLSAFFLCIFAISLLEKPSMQENLSAKDIYCRDFKAAIEYDAVATQINWLTGDNISARELADPFRVLDFYQTHHLYGFRVVKDKSLGKMAWKHRVCGHGAGMNWCEGF